MFASWQFIWIPLDRSQFAALTSPAHIIYTGGVKTVTKASLKWSLNPALVPTPHIAGKEKRKDIWDFIDSNNRNLTTRFGSDLSVVSRIKPLFDCDVRTISLDDLRLTQSYHLTLTVSKLIPRLLSAISKRNKTEESGSPRWGSEFEHY